MLLLDFKADFRFCITGSTVMTYDDVYQTKYHNFLFDMRLWLFADHRANTQDNNIECDKSYNIINM